MALRAPFPYYGGKSYLAETVLARLDPCMVYAEPFAGSLAVLLASEPHVREIVCDTDGHIANFWRALRGAPDEVAYWADYPSYHQDLTARHKWLIRWAREHGERLSDDVGYYDARAAGWWVWGLALWIGGGWCVDGDPSEKRPRLADHPGGRGVNAQRLTRGQRPRVTSKGPGGQGVSAQRATLDGEVGSGARLLPWFEALAERLSRVVVLNRSWESALTPTVLMHTPSGPKPPVGVLLDPPYRTDTGRADTLYHSDYAGESSDTATAAYRWAVEHGETYRIAYCCRDGDFDTPPGWTKKVNVKRGYA